MAGSASHRRPYISPSEARRPPRHSLSVFLFILVAGALLFWSAREMRLTASYGSLLSISERLSDRERVAAAALTAQLPQTEKLATSGLCRSDIVGAGLDILLVDLDSIDPVSDYDRWSQAIAKADTFVAHALRCMPSSAVYWTRLAMLRQAVAEQSAPLARLVTRSAVLSPAEYDLLMMRLAIAAKMSDATRTLVEPVIAKDATTLLTYAWTYRFAKDVIRLQPQARVKAIAAPFFLSTTELRQQEMRAFGFDPLQTNQP